MTDKQIIIDGVDVLGWTDGEVYYKLEHYSPKATKQIAFDLYKQLKRKENSEEKLVKQIQTICDFINNRPETFKGINGSVDKIITDYAERKEQECSFNTLKIIALQEALEQYETENDKLKQTLTEIKEIAEKLKNFYEELGKCEDLTVVRLKQILQKISECEVESE